VLLFVFLAFARVGGTGGFKVPSGSKLLLGIAVVLAVIDLIGATRRGRRPFRTHLLRHLKQAAASLGVLARSPRKLVGLVGGSAGVTLAYIAALAAAIAAAAPTPGGLGAMEAALVAGLTGVGMEPGVAVAAVLGYRLATYWLPGWLAFRHLDRRNFI
jgi:undecaprenyl-diphosphatase